MSEWKEYTLGSITTWKSGGTPSKQNPDYWNGDIPWVSAKTFTSSRVFDSEIKITSKGLENGSRLAPVNSILLLVRGSGLFNDIPIGIVKKPVAFNQDIKSIEVDPKVILAEYLMYWLLGNKPLLASKLEHTGIGAGKFETDIIKNLIIELPDLEIQREIISILDSIDSKIELNNQINKNLEALAQALFKQWFVDFEFPNENGQPYKSSGGEMVESELGMIPEGWTMGQLSELAFLSKENVKPFERPHEVFFHYSLPEFDNRRSPSQELGSQILSSKYLVTPLSILVSKLNPRIPRIWSIIQCNVNSVCSTEFQVIKPIRPEQFAFIHANCSSERFIKSIQAKVTGTSGSHQRVNPSDIINCSMIIPPSHIIENYCNLITDSLKKIELNILESTDLVRLRDSILPKLISGEIAVQGV